MKYKIYFSSSFKKSYKLCKKRVMTCRYLMMYIPARKKRLSPREVFATSITWQIERHLGMPYHARLDSIVGSE